MILNDKDIRSAIKKGQIIIQPYNPDSVEPNSLKLHFSNQVFLQKNISDILDIKDKKTYPLLEKLEPDEFGGFLLRKGEVYLAASRESVSLAPDICAFLDGTSNLARLGISVVLSSFVAPGFGNNNPGILTLEIVTYSAPAVRLYPDMVICNLLFAKLNNPPDKIYGLNGWNHSGEKTVVGSLLYKRYD